MAHVLACVQDKTFKINTCLLYFHLKKIALQLTMSVYYIKCAMKKGERGARGRSAGMCECDSGRRDIQQHQREGHNIRRGGGWQGLGEGKGARRRCMKAKALQTIVTLYMTSSCYNNTAVTYCTVQVRLNIWLDKVDHYHLQYP